MRKTLAGLAAIAMLGAVGAASSAELAIGAVDGYDDDEGIITLRSGSRFAIAEDLEYDDFEVATGCGSPSSGATARTSPYNSIHTTSSR